jgi:enoyl-CoA hydratase/carnithine racemase
MREDLLQALRDAAGNADCGIAVITGVGRAFSTGGDVAFMQRLQQNRDADGLNKLLAAGAAFVTQVVEMPKPVIASINGVAGETFVRIGLHANWGGTWLLPRLVGRSAAFEMMAAGR